MDQNPKLNYPSQFALLLGLMGVLIVISSFLVVFITMQVLHVSFSDATKAISLPANVNLARLLNTFASLLCFGAPAFVLAKILSPKPFTQLGFRPAISLKQVAIVLAITVAGIMLSGALGQLNESIPLPQKWYNKAKELEDKYKTAMLSMATMKTFWDYILTLLVLAAAPALVEEILFRGGFQQVFIGWTKNRWAGILITSILFSAIHFSYFGFLPRLALGVILGLIFSYSKNIWLNIFLHFLNNALVVTQLYVVGKQGKSIDKTVDENIPFWWGIIALVLLLILFRSFKKESEQVLAAEETSIHSSPENILS
jgi:membrane protease YdiL (CAAX protease family)